MPINNAYLNGIYEDLAVKSAHEPEFLQAVYEVLESLVPVVERRLTWSRPASSSASWSPSASSSSG